MHKGNQFHKNLLINKKLLENIEYEKNQNSNFMSLSNENNLKGIKY